MRILRQIGLIMLICLVCDGISSLLPFPFPGSVLAMLALLILFGGKILKPEQIQAASDFLLSHMMLVFLPSIIALINYLDVLQSVWLPLLAIVVISTLVAFFVAGTVVSAVIRIQEKFSRKKGGADRA